MQTLVSVSTIGTQSALSEAELAEAVRRELGSWFGTDEVAAWKLLRSYRIPFAQPNQVSCVRSLSTGLWRVSCEGTSAYALILNPGL